MVLSKTQIDKAGIILSNEIWKSEKEYEERTEVLNLYRQSHLLPITEVTLKLQEWLEKAFSHRYYIAQRLKRKPQILRKLRRLSVRLSQLQDIGGCRIIVENNNVTDELVRFIHKRLVRNKFFVIKKETDYRETGRDTTGYRAYCKMIMEHFETLTNDDKNHFTLSDVISALATYYRNDTNAFTRKIEYISERTGIPLQRAKRNGNTRAEHVEIMNFTRQLKGRRDSKYLGGRPDKKAIVPKLQYQIGQ